MDSHTIRTRQTFKPWSKAEEGQWTAWAHRAKQERAPSYTTHSCASHLPLIHQAPPPLSITPGSGNPEFILWLICSFIHCEAARIGQRWGWDSADGLGTNPSTSSYKQSDLKHDIICSFVSSFLISKMGIIMAPTWKVCWIIQRDCALKCWRVSSRLSYCYASWQGSWLSSPFSIVVEIPTFTILHFPDSLAARCGHLAKSQPVKWDFWVVSFKGRACLFLPPSNLRLLERGCKARALPETMQEKGLIQGIAEWKDKSIWIPHFHTISEHPTSVLQWER